MAVWVSVVNTALDEYGAGVAQISKPGLETCASWNYGTWFNRVFPLFVRPIFFGVRQTKDSFSSARKGAGPEWH